MRENQRVSRGQLLFRLDDQPYRLALAKIEAEIEIQRAEIRGLRAQWRTKREEIKAALSQQVYAQADYERQKDLADAQVRLDRRSSRKRARRPRRRAPAHRGGRGGPAAHRGAARRRSQDQGRRPSQGQADAGGARRGAAQPPPHHDRGAARRHRFQGAGAGQLRHRRACRRSPWSPTPISGSRPTSRRPSSRACGPGQPVTITVDTYPDIEVHRHGHLASPSRPARSSPCCRRRTPPATGSRWCSAFPVRISVTLPRGRSAAARRHERDGRDRHRPQPLVRRPPRPDSASRSASSSASARASHERQMLRSADRSGACSCAAAA